MWPKARLAPKKGDIEFVSACAVRNEGLTPNFCIFRSQNVCKTRSKSHARKACETIAAEVLSKASRERFGSVFGRFFDELFMFFDFSDDLGSQKGCQNK